MAWLQTGILSEKCEQLHSTYTEAATDYAHMIQNKFVGIPSVLLPQSARVQAQVVVA